VLRNFQHGIEKKTQHCPCRFIRQVSKFVKLEIASNNLARLPAPAGLEIVRLNAPGLSRRFFRFRLNTLAHQSGANAAGSPGGYFRFSLF
jgi:hypothetical protein